MLCLSGVGWPVTMHFVSLCEAGASSAASHSLSADDPAASCLHSIHIVPVLIVLNFKFREYRLRGFWDPGAENRHYPLPFLIIVLCLCHAGCDMTGYVQCFCTYVCFQVFFSLFSLCFCFCVCVCSFYSMDLCGLIKIKEEKKERKDYFGWPLIKQLVLPSV